MLQHLSVDQLKAIVAEATKLNAPKVGGPKVIDFREVTPESFAE